MKKFLIFFAVLCGSGAWGGGSGCVVKDIGRTAFFPNSNEYLYVHLSGREAGEALICGNGCDNGTRVCVSGSHAHDGKIMSNETRFYRCSSNSGGYSWEDIGSGAFSPCESTEGMKKITTVHGGSIYVPATATKTYSASKYYVSKKFCFLSTELERKTLCNEYGKRKKSYDKPLECKSLGFLYGKECGVRCNTNGTETKFVRKCVDGFEPTGRINPGNPDWAGKYFNCGVKKSTTPGASQPPAEEETQPGGGSSGTGRPNKCQTDACRSSEKCMACCKEPRDVTRWEPESKTCVCMNGGTFTKVDGKWICKVDSSLPVVTSKCDETLLARVREWQTQCAGNEEALAEIKKVLTFCDSKSANNDAFLRLYDELKQKVDTLCVEKDVQSQDDDIEMLIQVSKNRITTAQERLDGIQSGFKVSVWKDADGGFNTSRLVSDSVAGVVLGTAGGLITSSVVKKNQIKGGFEDIQCTVGGQVVAGWGDEFRVGIQ